MKTSVLTLLLMGFLIGVATSAKASVHWEVVNADESSIVVRLEITGGRLLPGEDGLATVELPGAYLIGDAGYPALPGAAKWIALPPTGDPVLQVLSMRDEAFGTARLAPVSVPELAPADGEGPRLREIRRFVEGAESYNVGPSDVAHLGDPVFQRRQRVVALGVRPVLYDARTGAVRVVRELTVRVQWPAPSITTDGTSSPDASMSAVVLNPEQAARWGTLSPRLEALRESIQAADMAPRTAPTPGISVLDPALLAADGIRLRVDQTAMVRVSVGDLMSAGGLPDTLPRSWLRVVQMRGNEAGAPGYPDPLVVDVPVHFFGAPDESQVLATTDEIYFHALRVEDDADTLEVGGARALPALPWGESNPADNIPPRYSGDQFNGENVYWVLMMEPPVGGWSRMEPVQVPASAGSPPAFYSRRDHFEADSGYRDEAKDPWVERFAWNGRLDSDVTRGLTLFDPLPGGSIQVDWEAGAHIAGTSPIEFFLEQGAESLLLATINLTNIGVMTRWSSNATSPPFVSGSVDFRMRRRVSGVDIGVNAFLDNVELAYDATFRARGDRLHFATGRAGGSVDVEVPGFSRADLLCFDVTDPRHPRWMDLSAANVEDRSAGGPTNFALSMQVAQPAGQELSFSVGPRIRFSRIGQAAIERDTVRDLFEVANNLQVLAVGPEFLRSEMDRWVQWRTQSSAEFGWNVDYVDVQQIYDQFSGGLISPWAIREFAKWAWLNWDAVALVLVGDANEDGRNAGGKAGPDLVPPSLHLQAFDQSRELLASDKWYGVFSYVPVGAAQYPIGLSVTSDILVGRFPVADAAALRTVIDKIIAYEQPGANDDWRRRTFWMSDDAYSSSLIGAAQGCYTYQSNELDFLRSQERASRTVEAALDSALTARVYNADDDTQDCRVGTDCENLGAVRTCFAANHRGDLLNVMSQGWLWLSYQGHANFDVLGHESFIFQGHETLLTNDGKPFVFFGMGCHISDFQRPTEGADGRAIGELMFGQPRGGAIATYGSSGFEFLGPNAAFMEILTDAMFDRRVPESPVFGAGWKNQWILGDAMARGELETLALRSALNIFRGDEMVAQYNLLGDPLLRLDAAPPRLLAARGGSDLADGTAIVADAGSTIANLDLSVVDEAGLDRLEITDTAGGDYSSIIPDLGGGDPRTAALALALPIRPQAYSVEIAAFDASYPQLRRSVFGLEVQLPFEVFASGEPVPPDASVDLKPGVPVPMRVSFEPPVDLSPEQIAVEFSGVDLRSVVATGSARSWAVDFDAVGRVGETPGVLQLVLDGNRTDVLGSATVVDPVAVSVGRHAVFPNPVRDRARLTVEVEGTVDRAWLSVYDVAGNEVSSREFASPALGTSGGGRTGLVLDFEARDRQGDELANGTYFYRVSVEGPRGSARSDMGRVVIMR